MKATTQPVSQYKKLTPATTATVKATAAAAVIPPPSAVATVVATQAMPAK